MTAPDPAQHFLANLFPFTLTETFKLCFSKCPYDFDDCQTFLPTTCQNSAIAKVPLALVNIKHIDYQRAN